MKTQYAMALTLFAGAAMGAGIVQGLHAQAQPPVYLVTETDISNMDAFSKEYLPVVQAAIKSAGGSRLAGGSNITTFEGTPPKSRVAINRFDSLEQVKAWRNSPEFKAARKIGEKYATFRSFAVEGLPQ
jgi:uncharacterized protein (DUF1330 family)